MTTENIDNLKEKINYLERRVEFLKERVEQARWLSEMLVRAKAAHPRFPFWEWELRNIHTTMVQRNILRVCLTLFARIEGTWELDETCKDIPGIPSDQLYQPRPPTIEEVYSFLKIAGGFTSNADVMEMLMARRMFGHESKLIDFVLSG